MIRPARSLTQQAADTIRTRIVRGELPMGAPLSENALATELGVSKTPVHEALLQLKMEGLVSIHLQRGSFVFDMTPAQIVELGELREALELAALALAMRRNKAALVVEWRAIVAAMRHAIDGGDDARYRALDASFHDAMLRLSGNGLMYEHYRGFALRVHALRHWLSVRPNMNEASLLEHEAIVERAAREDMEGARIALAAHMQGTIWNFNAVQSGDAA